MPVVIRDETPADYSAIEGVIADAFRRAVHSSGTEQFIVNALRNAGQLTVSLVAETRGFLIGHAAASPVRISDGTPDWYGLGPIAVAPESQARGVGTRLVTEALNALQSAGAAGCVVLGEPAFYGRFGFKPAAPFLILPNVPPDCFLALHWRGKEPKGFVTYHDAFEAAE